jgi:hypothetical protein
MCNSFETWGKKKFYKKKGNKRGKDYLQTNPKEPMVGGKG